MLQNLESVAVIPNPNIAKLEMLLGMPVTSYEGRVAEFRGPNLATDSDEYLVFVLGKDGEYSQGVIVADLYTTSHYTDDEGGSGDLPVVEFRRVASDEEMEVTIPEDDFDLFL
jgi:hypothetical protein